jgi:hypothetical protein
MTTDAGLDDAHDARETARESLCSGGERVSKGRQRGGESWFGMLLTRIVRRDE